MRILQVHNRYQNPGGEDVVVASEYEMLTQRGDTVLQWIVEPVQESGTLDKIKIALNSRWSRASQQEIRAKVAEFRPEVIHVHNVVPLISPSIYAAAHLSDVPTVHTLHNYRLICPGSPLYRDGHLCEDCVGKAIPYPGVLHGCYRDSRVQSAVTVANLTWNRMRGTYRNDIDVYIALTEFARQKFIQGGLPAEKIVVKPNFVSDSIQPAKARSGGFMLFAGRLVPHKGIETLVRAWRMLEQPVPLKVVGKGPLEDLFRTDVPAGIDYLGQVPREEVLKLMQDADALVFPSEWYEGFPMSIAEAFASGLPVIAARLGAAAEIIQEGRSGWFYEAGEAAQLARVVETVWSAPGMMRQFGASARQQCDELYTVDKNYQMLLDIYQTAIDRFGQRRNVVEPAHT